MDLKGRGRLATRDGAYRPGRYEVRVRRSENGGLASATGTFVFDDGADRGPDEEFLGYATLVLEDGREAEVTIGGKSGASVDILGIDLDPQSPRI